MIIAAIDRYEVVLTLIGAVALVAAWVPAYTQRRPLSLPIILVAIGTGLFLLPLGITAPQPQHHLDVTEHLTELGVLVALMGAGLKIDRPFAWRSWALTWRMLVVAMPLTIALTAIAGATIGGLGGVSALLLGSVLAPTDPVLASDVQVGEPTLDERAPEEEDDVRFTLTSEGGLNDALAFPFVYAAVRITDSNSSSTSWIWQWVAWDLIGRVLIGAAVGWVVGRLIGVVAFRPPGRLSALADTPQGFVAIAATLLAYGTTELLQGYGFLAVFVAAVVIRGSERHHDFHRDLHGFAEQTENLLSVGLLLLLGGSVVSGVLNDLDVGGVAVAVVVVLVIRPISGLVALVRTQLNGTERATVAFFGIRGFGSIYYLAYALNDHRFEQGDRLWSIVTLTLLISIALHGVSASRAMAAVDALERRRARSRSRVKSAAVATGRPVRQRPLRSTEGAPKR